MTSRHGARSVGHEAGRVCSVVQATSAMLVLNSSTLELISVHSDSYVYTAGPPRAMPAR